MKAAIGSGRGEAQKRSARKWKLALLEAECRLHSADSVFARPGGPAAQPNLSQRRAMSRMRGRNLGELSGSAPTQDDV